jgi:hypothetical protein
MQLWCTFRAINPEGPIVETTNLFEWVRSFADQHFVNEDDCEDRELPHNAIAKLLLMAAISNTTSPTLLAQQTGYGLSFVLGVAWNMRVNRRWTEEGYDFSQWLTLSAEYDEREFWEDVSAAAGELWFPGAKMDETVDTIKIYNDIYDAGSPSRHFA